MSRLRLITYRSKASSLLNPLLHWYKGDANMSDCVKSLAFLLQLSLSFAKAVANNAISLFRKVRR